MKKVAIYSRKSKETDTGESIKTQIQMCKEYFLRQDKEFEFEIFQDEGFSGGNVNRPQFQRMMLLAKHGEFDIVACYKVDRIGRNIVDFMNTFSDLEKHNISLVSITEGFDPNTPAGRMMMTMIAGFAEMERMNIAQRVKDNMHALGKMGRWSGGTPATGYKSVRLQNGDKTAMYLELLPEWESKLKTIFENVAQGLTCFQVGKEMNMSPKTISNMINNPVYCVSDNKSKKYLESLGYIVYGELNGKGYMPYNRRPRLKNGKKLFNAEGMFAAVSKHTAPISSEIWIAANENIKSRGKEKRPHTSELTWLAHLIKCPCGRNMYVRTGRPRKDGTRTYYMQCIECGVKWINVKKAEKDVLHFLENMNNNQKALKSFLTSNSSIDYDLEIKKLNSQLKKNNNMLSKLADKLILLEGAALKVVTEKMNNLSKENEKISTDILILEREKLFNNKEDNIEILKDNISKFIMYFDKLNMQEKQLAIRSIIKEIKWNGEKLRMQLLE